MELTQLIASMNVLCLPEPKTVYQSINHAYVLDKRTGELYSVADTYRHRRTGKRVKLEIQTRYLPTPSGQASTKVVHVHGWKVSLKPWLAECVDLDALDASLLERVEQ